MCTRPIGITLFAKCCPSHVAKCNLWPGADQFVMMLTRCWPGADLDHLRACCAMSHLPCFIQAQSSTSRSAVSPVLCLEAVSVLSSGFNFGYHTCQHFSPEIGRCFWILQPFRGGNASPTPKVERTQSSPDPDTAMNRGVSSSWIKQPEKQWA